MIRPDWINRAKPVEVVCVDVGFLVAESYYYGPENNFSRDQWQQLREPLYQPKVEKYGDYVLSAVLDEATTELVQYYHDVVRMAARHRKELKQQKSYFWMRPIIFSRDDFAMTFPWYDTWQEAVPVLDALSSASDGLLFEDMDQSWEFNVFAEAERVFLRESDSDSGEEHFVIATSRAPIASQVVALRQRMGRLLQELSAALGRDFWSRRTLN